MLEPAATVDLADARRPSRRRRRSRRDPLATTRRRPAARTSPSRSSSATRVPLLRRRRARSRPRSGPASSTRSSGLDPAAAADARDATPGARPLRYPATTLTTVAPEPPPVPPGAARPGRPARRCSRRSTAGGSSTVAFGGPATVADAPIPPTSWAFDAAASPRRRPRPRGGRRGADEGRLDEGRRALAAAGREGARTRSRSSVPDAEMNPALYAVAEQVAADWDGARPHDEVVEARPGDRRWPTASGKGEFDGGRRRHLDRPRPGPVPAARVEPDPDRRLERRRRSRTRPSTRSSRRPASPAPTRPGRPPTRPSRRSSRPAATCSRSPSPDEVVVARDTLDGRGRPARRRRVGSVLGCANMAPRQRPVSVVRAGRGGSTPRWRNWQTR